MVENSKDNENNWKIEQTQYSTKFLNQEGKIYLVFKKQEGFTLQGINPNGTLEYFDQPKKRKNQKFALPIIFTQETLIKTLEDKGIPHEIIEKGLSEHKFREKSDDDLKTKEIKEYAEKLPVEIRDPLVKLLKTYKEERIDQIKLSNEQIKLADTFINLFKEVPDQGIVLIKQNEVEFLHEIFTNRSSEGLWSAFYWVVSIGESKSKKQDSVKSPSSEQEKNFALCQKSFQRIEEEFEDVKKLMKNTNITNYDEPFTRLRVLNADIASLMTCPPWAETAVDAVLERDYETIAKYVEYCSDIACKIPVPASEASYAIISGGEDLPANDLLERLISDHAGGEWAIFKTEKDVFQRPVHYLERGIPLQVTMRKQRRHARHVSSLDSLTPKNEVKKDENWQIRFLTEEIENNSIVLESLKQMLSDRKISNTDSANIEKIVENKQDQIQELKIELDKIKVSSAKTSEQHEQKGTDQWWL